MAASATGTVQFAWLVDALPRVVHTPRHGVHGLGFAEPAATAKKLRARKQAHQQQQ